MNVLNYLFYWNETTSIPKAPQLSPSLAPPQHENDIFTYEEKIKKLKTNVINLQIKENNKKRKQIRKLKNMLDVIINKEDKIKIQTKIDEIKICEDYKINDDLLIKRYIEHNSIDNYILNKYFEMVDDDRLIFSILHEVKNDDFNHKFNKFLIRTKCKKKLMEKCFDENDNIIRYICKQHIDKIISFKKKRSTLLKSYLKSKISSKYYKYINKIHDIELLNKLCENTLKLNEYIRIQFDNDKISVVKKKNINEFHDKLMRYCAKQFPNNFMMNFEIVYRQNMQLIVELNNYIKYFNIIVDCVTANTINDYFERLYEIKDALDYMTKKEKINNIGLDELNIYIEILKVLNE